MAWLGALLSTDGSDDPTRLPASSSGGPPLYVHCTPLPLASCPPLGPSLFAQKLNLSGSPSFSCPSAPVLSTRERLHRTRRRSSRPRPCPPSRPTRSSLRRHPRSSSKRRCSTGSIRAGGRPRVPSRLHPRTRTRSTRSLEAAAASWVPLPLSLEDRTTRSALPLARVPSTTRRPPPTAPSSPPSDERQATHILLPARTFPPPSVELTHQRRQRAALPRPPTRSPSSRMNKP